jgi:hypothetical protein
MPASSLAVSEFLIPVEFERAGPRANIEIDTSATQTNTTGNADRLPELRGGSANYSFPKRFKFKRICNNNGLPMTKFRTHEAAVASHRKARAWPAHAKKKGVQ